MNKQVKKTVKLLFGLVFLLLCVTVLISCKAPAPKPTVAVKEVADPQKKKLPSPIKKRLPSLLKK